MNDFYFVVTVAVAIFAYLSISRGLEMFLHPLRMKLVDDYCGYKRNNNISKDVEPDLEFMLRHMNSSVAAWTIVVMTPIAILMAAASYLFTNKRAPTPPTGDRTGMTLLRAMFFTVGNSPLALVLFGLMIFLFIGFAGPLVVVRGVSGMANKSWGIVGHRSGRLAH